VAGVADGAGLAADAAGAELADGADEADEAGAADEAKGVVEAAGAGPVDVAAELAGAGAGAELAGAEAVTEATGAGWAAVGWAELAGVDELPCEEADVTALTWGDEPEVTVWTADEAAEPTAPSRPDEPDEEPLPEAVEPDGALAAEPGGVVSAWAWRENRTRMARIPAASSMACIARRAMQRMGASATGGAPAVGRRFLEQNYFFTIVGRLHDLTEIYLTSKHM
jgi:hypothetical protein